MKKKTEGESWREAFRKKMAKKSYGKFSSSLCIIEKLLNKTKPQKLLM